MAWTRTGITLMGFGFVIERFGLFLHMFMSIEGQEWQRDASFWVGIVFILLGALVEVSSVMQYRSVLKTLKPIEIPEGYWVNIGMYTNLLVAAVGVALSGIRRRPVGNGLIIAGIVVAAVGSAFAGLGQGGGSVFTAVAAGLLYAGFVSKR